MLLTFVFIKASGQEAKKTETLTLGDIELYYEVYGQGDPLFLLHGWTQSSQFWKPYIQAFAEQYEVYVVDLRGHGNSSSLTAEFSIQRTAKDLLALWKKLNIKKAKAIGLSFGGLTLLELSSSHPEVVEAMVLIGVSHEYDGGQNQSAAEQFSLDQLPQAFLDELRRTHVRGEDQIQALFNPKLNYKISLSEEQLKAMKQPTLIIQGDRDEILGVAPAVKLHQRLPNSSLWVVPGSGHIAIGGDQKENFIKTTLEFLKAN